MAQVHDYGSNRAIIQRPHDLVGLVVNVEVPERRFVTQRGHDNHLANTLQLEYLRSLTHQLPPTRDVSTQTRPRNPYTHRPARSGIQSPS